MKARFRTERATFRMEPLPAYLAVRPNGWESAGNLEMNVAPGSRAFRSGSVQVTAGVGSAVRPR
ncbi:hypothetical protein [Paenibacillus methanolicus]|nr:hypothetical protein [Paenibacillus methanolicus]